MKNLFFYLKKNLNTSFNYNYALQNFLHFRVKNSFPRSHSVVLKYFLS